jgi:parallel beta-helix repeat protein
VIALAAVICAIGAVCAPGASAAPSSWITALSTTSATVRWRPVAGAARYEVFRNGRRIARVRGTSVRMARLAPATWYGIRVRARVGARVTPLSDLLPVVTPAPRGCTAWSRSSGSDAAPGSQTQPVRTVQRLVDLLGPGDVGCVADPAREDVTISASGTALAPMVLRSAPGTRVTLTGRLQIAKGASHIVVAGLRLDGRAIDGPGAEDLPSPTVNGSDARFLDNDVFNQRTRVCFVIGSIRGWGRAQHTLLARNRIHDCGRRDASDHGNNHHHGIYVEGADDTRIVSNVIYQNADRGIQLYPDARKSTIVGNVIDGNGEGVIFSGAEGLASSGNAVIGNVVTNSRTRSDIEHWWEDPSRPGSGNIAARNCVGGGHDGPFALPIVGYRAIGNVRGHPKYVDASAGDLRLRSRMGTASCATWMRSRGLPLAPFTQ